MAQQPQKPQFLTLLLWMALFFTGYQLFFAQPKGPVVPSGDLLFKLQLNDFKVEDVTALTTYNAYDSALKDSTNAEIKVVREDLKLSEADRARKIKQLEDLLETKKFEAQMLVADSQYKAAKNTKELQRVIFAFDRLQDLERTHVGKPIWTQKFRVAYHSKFTEGPRAKVAYTDKFGNKFVELTPAEMKTEARTLASDLGKNTPVWGFFPGYELIDFVVGITGRTQVFSYAFACLLLAFFVRAVVFPLSKKQMIFGRQMAQLSPLAQEIKDQYKSKDGKPIPMEKQNEMNQKVMGLYSEYGLNPFSGCLPALLQMPLFLLIYQAMLHYRFEFEKGTFLWITPAVGKATDGFLAANLGQKDYALIVIYGISMLVTTWLQPVSDPTNVRQQRIMGMSMAGLFSVAMFFWPVPSAFVLYWVFTNILATAQSLWIYKMPLAPLQKKNTATGGRFPMLMNQMGGQQPPMANGKIIKQEIKTGTPKTHKPKKKKK